jgi:hypothetical protein
MPTHGRAARRPPVKLKCSTNRTWIGIALGLLALAPFHVRNQGSGVSRTRGQRTRKHARTGASYVRLSDFLQ